MVIVKGLLYREWKLLRKYLGLLFGIFFGLFMLHVLILLSYRCGNLSHNLTEDMEKFRTAIGNMFFLEEIILLLGASAFAQTLYNDVRTKWCTFAYTLPGGGRQSVLARFIGMGIYLLAAMAAGALAAIVLSAVRGRSLSGDEWKLLVFIGMVFCSISGIGLVIAHLTKSQNKSIAIYLIVVVIIAGVFLAQLLQTQDEAELLRKLLGWKDSLMDFVSRFTAVSVAAALVIYAGCCLLTVKIVQRKEK